MRFLWLALAGPLLVASPALAASPKERGAVPRAKVSAAAPAGVAAAAARPGAGREAATGATVAGKAGRHGGSVIRRAASARASLGGAQDSRAAIAIPAGCERGSSRGRGKAGLCHAQPVASWTQGLPPAAGVQSADCPAGTMATLAIGHDDVVRCMPL